ncbi:hypothetical protein [Azospirillum sp. sgz301742]
MNKTICGALAVASLWSISAQADPIWFNCSVSEIRRAGLAGVLKSGHFQIGVDEAKKSVSVPSFSTFMQGVPSGVERAVSSVNDASVFVAYKGPWNRVGDYPDNTFFALILSINRADGEMALKAGPYRLINQDDPKKWGPATLDLDEMSQAKGRCKREPREF